MQIDQPADLRNSLSLSSIRRDEPRIRFCLFRPSTSSGHPCLLYILPARSRARRPTRMHASFTQVFSSHVMGCVPLVRLSRPFATRVNPSRGHLWPFQSARTFSTRITSRIPVNLSRLAHPVRHLWGQQQPRARLPPQTFADEQEEAIKANLLETAYRGGQPGDMMLRCNAFTLYFPPTFATDHKL